MQHAIRYGVPTVLGMASLACVAARAPHRLATAPMQVLIVGGGPSRNYNQVAIESNVRYVDRLLPADAVRRITFADADKTHKTVQWQDDAGKLHYRAPSLTQIDAPSESDAVFEQLRGVASRLRAKPGGSALLYFTGHGSPNQASRYDDNRYDLWANGTLSVTDLAVALDGFPKDLPVAVVMVQCFSGAFGNLLFKGGLPDGAPTDLKLAGFFASVPQREAAGCTPEINEANYRDFTGYFFAALSGIDRLGRPVTGADYNRDGKVGMNEAFDYALVHDVSIDTPVCTSDTFLRRFVTTPDDQVFAHAFADVLKWANPGQRAALQQLSDAIKLDGPNRLASCYDRLKHMNPDSDDMTDVRVIRFVRLAKSVVLAHELPGLRNRDLDRRYRDLLAQEARNPLKP